MIKATKGYDTMDCLKVKRKSDDITISYILDKTGQIHNMSWDILENKEIPSLYPVYYKELAFGKRCLQFVIRDMECLKDLLRNGVSFGQFLDIVSQIADTIISCEAHAITSLNLELSPDLIFYGNLSQKISMLYWPLLTSGETPDLAEAFRSYGEIYRCDPRNEMYRDKYLSFFRSRAKFDVRQFRSHLKKLYRTWYLKNGETEAYSSHIDVRETGQDTVSDTAPLSGPLLYRVSNQTSIVLKKFSFTIGRSEQCDYSIMENAFIGRIHLTLLQKDDGVYIRDNGSVNGTFVNGNRIPQDVDLKLNRDDFFVIDDEKFVFVTA